MNTTAAALQAHVTAATIRAWARRGVIAATKTAGRWIIDTASLAHRIAIAAMRTRKAAPVTDQPTYLLTDDKDHYLGTVAVSGPAAALKAAYESGSPITLSGAYAGEQVVLGFTARDSLGRDIKTISLDHSDGDTAVYLINEDLDRLTSAPKVAAAIDAILAGAALADAAQDAADDTYLNHYYE
jgi:hypothetical protein